MNMIDGKNKSAGAGPNEVLVCRPWKAKQILDADAPDSGMKSMNTPSGSYDYDRSDVVLFRNPLSSI